MAMLPVSTAPGQVASPEDLAPGPQRRGRRPFARLTRAVRSSRKATTGTVLLVIFILLALFPGVIAP